MFHVPERSRLTVGELATPPNVPYGAFLVLSPEPGWFLYLIACDAQGHPDVPGSVGWEHVSVSVRNRAATRQRTPTWREMSYVKDLCWDEEDVVVQFHPKRSEYVNLHPHCLHLWRYTLAELPTPTPNLVGPVTPG